MERAGIIASSGAIALVLSCTTFLLHLDLVTSGLENLHMTKIMLERPITIEPLMVYLGEGSVWVTDVG